MHSNREFSILVDPSDVGKRLDVLISDHISSCSRAYASTLIHEGNVHVQGDKKKPGYRVKTGESIIILIPSPKSISFKPEPIDIEIIYDDHDLIAVNKPPGLVVHPAPGHDSGTLVNGLLYHCPDLRGIGGEIRPGIVHRLDKDTSGVMIIAKNALSLDFLARQFKSRRIEKTYLTVVHGELKKESGEISFPIGRHPANRKQMSVRTDSRGKQRDATTLWIVKQRLKGSTLLEVRPLTGRTHQIRVHCAAIHHPIIGDPVYGKKKTSKNRNPEYLRAIGSIKRQMLHAWKISFIHPSTEKQMTIQSPVPEDMTTLIENLKTE